MHTFENMVIARHEKKGPLGADLLSFDVENYGSAILVEKFQQFVWVELLPIVRHSKRRKLARHAVRFGICINEMVQ